MISLRPVIAQPYYPTLLRPPPPRGGVVNIFSQRMNESPNELIVVEVIVIAQPYYPTHCSLPCRAGAPRLISRQWMTSLDLCLPSGQGSQPRRRQPALAGLASPDIVGENLRATDARWSWMECSISYLMSTKAHTW